MFSVYDCIAEQHDLRLVVAAGLICFLACYTAFNMLARARSAPSNLRVWWTAAAAFAVGGGIWATHFVAMLGFRAELPISYDTAVTIVSIVVAVVISGAGFAVATSGRFGMPLLGGTIIGAGIGAMHYVGIYAWLFKGTVEFDRPYVVASLLLGILLGGVASKIGTAKFDLVHRLVAASLLTLAICAMHFTGMTAIRILPDPTLIVPDDFIPAGGLVVSVVAVTLSILAIGLSAAIIDERVAARTARESIREAVTLRAEVEQRTAAQTRLSEAIENIPEGFALLDSEMRFLIYNQRFLDLYPIGAPAVKVGASLEDMLRVGAENGEYPGLSSPDEVQAFVHRWTSRFRSGEPYFGEGDFRDGRWVLVSHRRTPSGDYATVRADITVQKVREAEKESLLNELIATQAAVAQAHDEALLTAAMLRAVADAVPAMVSFVDRDERYAYCNRGYRDTLGIDPESLIGKLVRDSAPQDGYEASKPHIDAALGGSDQVFLRSLTINGEKRAIEQRFIPKQMADGTIAGFYSIGSDVTERQRVEQALTLEASTDVLTGLLNRRALMDVLEHQSALWSGKGENTGNEGAVLFLDIDHFKQINDTLGHDVGDELLKSFADKIRSVVRNTDTVARLGGDEFVVILTAPDIEEVARRVSQNLLETVRLPVELSGHSVAVSTSIGIALVSRSDARIDPAQVLKEADLALYSAKQAGRNTFALRKLDARTEGPREPALEVSLG